MQEWVPSATEIQGLAQLLQNSISSDSAVQASVVKQLETFNSIPDYNRYLGYIFAMGTSYSSPVRAIAGLTLKNNVKDHYTRLSPQVLEYVLYCCLIGTSDAETVVRSTAGTIMTTLVTKDFSHIHKILGKLVENLQVPNIPVVEVFI
jgi:transportin-1